MNKILFTFTAIFLLTINCQGQSDLTLDEANKLMIKKSDEKFKIIDFNFYSTSKQSTDSLLHSLKSQNQFVDLKIQEYNQNIWGITGKTKDKIEISDESIAIWVSKMKSIGSNLNCEFDGWGYETNILTRDSLNLDSLFKKIDILLNSADQLIKQFVIIDSTSVREIKTQTENFSDLVVFGDIKGIKKQISLNKEIINSKDEYGFTALHNVMAEEQIEAIQLIINNGANVNTQNNDGIAPLHLAAYIENVDILLENGARINITDNNGNTPLHVLASEGDDYNDIIEHLLLNGADKSIKNNNGETPLDIAISRQDSLNISSLK